MLAMAFWPSLSVQHNARSSTPSLLNSEARVAFKAAVLEAGDAEPPRSEGTVFVPSAGDA